jgi:signal transduction histidine kinase/tetratricopeptide (TPR) repeat protein
MFSHIFSHCRHFLLMAVCLLWAASQLVAQSRRLDSLRTLLVTATATNEARMLLLNELSQAYQYTSSDSSLMYANQAMQLAERLGSLRGKAWALYHRNYALYNQGKYDVAMETLVQALPLFEQLHDSNGLAHTLNDIGNIHKRREHYSDALGFYRRALDVYERIGNAEGAALELCNMGITWKNQGDYQKCFEKSSEGLRRSQAIGYNYGTVFALTNLGQYWMYWGKLDSAIACFERGLRLAKEIRNEKYTGQLYYFIGLVYARQHNFEQAVENATRGVEIAQRARFAERVKEGYQTFVEIYTAKQDFKRALNYHHLYTNLKDSIFSVEVQDNISALQTKIATEQKENEIQLLRKEQQIQSLIRNSLVGGVVFALLLLGVAVSRYNIKQRSAAQLRQANEQLAGANAEITRQMDVQAEQAREIEIANTALQELNATLAEKNTRLLDLDNEKNEFLGIVAHDLKNPLTGIRGLAEMMAEYGEDMDANERKNFLTSIITSSNRMFELLTNLLDINTIERGGIHLNPVAFDLSTKAEVVTDLYRDRAAQKDITLHFQGLSVTNTSTHDASQATATVFTDETIMHQVLDNLISNAVKYSPNGKQIWVDVQERLWVVDKASSSANEKTPQSRNLVRVLVRDEGPGISPEDMKKLFGKFARLSAQPTGGEHSTGLGLSIVKRLVEAMGGRVWCESELGKGATFILELPAMEA